MKYLESVSVLLNLDGGEYDIEPEELYALADIVHIACGGHAGDERSMNRVVAVCAREGTRVGAHPSYVDREGFGRRPRIVTPEILSNEIAEQCATLKRIAAKHNVDVTSAKPHGALYHAAHADDAIAKACLSGIRRALGSKVAIVGLPNGELERAAKDLGHPYLREAFADRGKRPDGSLIPRTDPGAVLDDPTEAANQARTLAKSGEAETLCIHADTPSSLLIARAVRAALDEKTKT
jgi:5-oxoprolinase (ATP-hydrolysing) subunit A